MVKCGTAVFMLPLRAVLSGCGATHACPRRGYLHSKLRLVRLLSQCARVDDLSRESARGGMVGQQLRRGLGARAHGPRQGRMDRLNCRRLIWDYKVGGFDADIALGAAAHETVKRPSGEQCPFDWIRRDAREKHALDVEAEIAEGWVIRSLVPVVRRRLDFAFDTTRI